MVLYDYCCEECGMFEAWQSMSRSAEPASCPGCGRESRRVLSAPFLADMDPYSRIAHQRNEKSAHEPQLESRVGQHHASASCSHGHTHGSSRRSPGHGPSRPWMIGH